MIIEKKLGVYHYEEKAPSVETPEQKQEKRGKIIFVFALLFFGVLVMLFAFFYRATFDRKLPRMQNKDIETAFRGNIITKDGFEIATSQKFYKITVDSRSIDPNKKELFVKLYSIYAKEDPKKIERVIAKEGYVTLSLNVNSQMAAQIKDLSRKFYQFGVFVPFENPKTKRAVTHGMDIIESGQTRDYLVGDTLTPVIGYTQRQEKEDFLHSVGIKGVEGFYNANLSAKQDARLVGPRDVGSNIILSKETLQAHRIDGQDAVLNIELRLQRRIEGLIDERIAALKAREIIVGVMEAKTGKILTLATSSRFLPNSITKNDYSALNVAAVEYAYEVGSVFKPFVFSVLLKENAVDAFERILLGGGRYTVGAHTITDSHSNDYLNAEDIITVSSNIGMAKLATRISEERLLAGLREFGFASPSEIDLGYEQVGHLPTLASLKQSAVDRASISFGYGMSATFMQLLRGYNAINNNGILVAPRVVSHLQRGNEKVSVESESRQILPPAIAWEMKRILTKVVESARGTARRARIPGLLVAGKTGTAHIYTRGSYSKERYNASFFGFAGDKTGASYTIGVLVREPEPVSPNYFASVSALPIFKRVAEILAEDGYLKIDQSAKKHEVKHTGKDILD